MSEPAEKVYTEEEILIESVITHARNACEVIRKTGRANQVYLGDLQKAVEALDSYRRPSPAVREE